MFWPRISTVFVKISLNFWVGELKKSSQNFFGAALRAAPKILLPENGLNMHKNMQKRPKIAKYAKTCKHAPEGPNMQKHAKYAN